MAVIKKMVITGGPCGGKTTSKSAILEAVLKAGLIPVFLGETATELISSGVMPGNVISYDEFQDLLLKLQIAKEDIYLDKFQASDKDIVLFYDRSIIDNKAYVDEVFWNKMLANNSLDEAKVFSRYDIVLHLVSAACGAEKYYTNANNLARTETLEEARMQEKKNVEAYYGFPHIYYFDNNENFESKVNNVVSAVLGSIGKAKPILGAQRKYLVRKIDIQNLKDIGATCANITQVYLNTKNSTQERRLRKIEYPGSTAYYYTKKDAGRMITDEIPISEKEYNILLDERYCDVDIVKKRWYFNYNNLYFQYDEFELGGDFENYAILEAQTTNMNEKVEELPIFFNEEYDITDCNLLTNFQFARDPEFCNEVLKFARYFSKHKI